MRRNSAPSLLQAYGRSVTGLLVASLASFAVGWALSSLTLGVLLAGLGVLGASICVPPGLWYFGRFTGQIRRMNLERDPILSREYFAALLKQPGPQPRLWMWRLEDAATLWFESPGFLGRPRQDLLLTEAWLRQSPEHQRREWRRLWSEIASQTRSQRRLRSFQMTMWMGAWTPLQFLFSAFGVLLHFLGFRDLPSPAFLFQRTACRLQELWFGFEPTDTLSLVAEATPRSGPVPTVWNSLLLGVWTQVSASTVHPLWRILMRRGAILTPDEDLA